MPTDKPTHTPKLPLRAVREGDGWDVVDANGSILATSINTGAPEADREDAEFLVRSVNSLPACIEAMEAALSVYLTAFPTGALRHAAEESVAEQLRAAIKLARGE